MQVQHAEADLGEVRLHYVTAGQGPAVLLLHGWPQSWRMWEAIIPGSATRYRVVAPDLRGLGDSSRPEGGYDKRTVANDLWRLMSEVLGEQRFFLVGHDWGGPTAFSLAAQHRDAVKRLAIFDAPVPGDGSPVFHAGRWHHGFHWEDGLAEALTAGREDTYLRFFYRTFGGRPDCVPEAAQQDYIRAYSQPGAMHAGFEYYRAMQQDVADNEAMLARDGKLRMPVLCYGGPLGRGRGMGAIEVVAAGGRGCPRRDRRGLRPLDPGGAAGLGDRATAGFLRRGAGLTAWTWGGGAATLRAMSSPWTVASETGRLTEVLVCAPDHYRWIPTNAIARRTLAAGGQADLQGLQAQHRELVAALEQGGARVHHLPPEPHLPTWPIPATAWW